MKKIKQFLKDKKGKIGLNDIVPIAITFIVIGVVLGVSGDVLTNLQATQCPAGSTFNTTDNQCHTAWNVTSSPGYDFNATQNGLQAVDELAGWQETWAVVVALAVIIGVLGFLYVRT